MNNNRNNNSNNRRRGRGNRNQGGGGNQGNRIDSRARGNAPQLLDKFKKLAEDAHRNGDRVQAEYYLQFADHYFRVIADNRTRIDERGARRDERDQDDFESQDDNEGETGRRYDGPREGGRDNQRDGQRDGTRDNRRERPRRDDGPRVYQDDRGSEGTPIDAGDEATPFETQDNPFVRESRDDTASRPRRAPRPRRTNGQEPGIDAAALPPAFSANDTDGRDADAASEAAPRRRRKRGDEETLSAVG